MKKPIAPRDLKPVNAIERLRRAGYPSALEQRERDIFDPMSILAAICSVFAAFSVSSSTGAHAETCRETQRPAALLACICASEVGLSPHSYDALARAGGWRDENSGGAGSRVRENCRVQRSEGPRGASESRALEGACRERASDDGTTPRAPDAPSPNELRASECAAIVYTLRRRAAVLHRLRRRRALLQHVRREGHARREEGVGDADHRRVRPAVHRADELHRGDRSERTALLRHLQHYRQWSRPWIGFLRLPRHYGDHSRPLGGAWRREPAVWPPGASWPRRRAIWGLLLATAHEVMAGHVPDPCEEESDGRRSGRVVGTGRRSDGDSSRVTEASGVARGTGAQVLPEMGGRLPLGPEHWGAGREDNARAARAIAAGRWERVSCGPTRNRFYRVRRRRR